MHGKRRSSVSEYGRQLREKQRIKNMYGVLERQFRNYVLDVRDKTGDKRELLYKKLERRFDNVIYRLGLAKSRRQARQKINHNHFQVNGKRMNIPSYEVKAGDIIKLKEKRSRGRRLDDHEKKVDYQLLVNQRYATDWLENLYKKGTKMYGGKMPEITRFNIYDTPEEIDQKMAKKISLIL